MADQNEDSLLQANSYPPDTDLTEEVQDFRFLSNLSE